MTIDQLLNTKQFNFYINATELSFFANKNKDTQDLMFIFQSDLNDIYNGLTQKPEIECFNPDDSDAFMTALQANLLKKIISLNKQKVNSDFLTLYFGGLSQKYLTWILNAEAGENHERCEFCYADGEIVVINGNSISTNKPDDSLQEIKASLAEGVLIASNQFANTKRPFSKTGTYVERGYSPTPIREKFDTDTLKKFAKSQRVISSLDQTKFSEYIRSGILKKWEVLKYINRKMIPADIAIDLMIEGIFSREEIYNKFLHIRNDKELVKCDEIGFSSKLLLYSIGRMKITDLEKALKYEEQRSEISLSKKDITKIAKYYKGNINKIAELLTHNVLDFMKSMEFLDTLVEENVINSEDKTYLVEIMNDFKTNELLNNTENASREHSSTIIKPKVHSHGVTIDPEIRKQYFESIGNIKEIFVNGQNLIKDDSEGVSKKNSLDGYQLILIPDKKIAVLEKFYEVTRDKNGNIVYKKDEKGNLIAAIENATYVMPIAMAKDFAEKKNKQELRKSPYVVATSHTMNWVQNTEQAIKTVAGRANLQVEFEKENTEKWSKLVSENYKMLREKRDKDIDELL